MDCSRCKSVGIRNYAFFEVKDDMSKLEKFVLKIGIYCFAVVFVLCILISNIPLPDLIGNKDYVTIGRFLFSCAGKSGVIVVLFIVIFNQWLWRMKILNYIPGFPPVLSRKYSGTVRFKQEKEPSEITVTVEIRQTLLKVSIKLSTDESMSESIASSIDGNNLIYTYFNTPRGEIQDISPKHYGTAILKLDDPKHLIGNYFTDRLTRGSIVLDVTKR